MKNILASIAIIGLTCSPASAMNSHSNSLTGVVGVNSASLSYTVEDQVATLFGNVESNIESALAVAHIKKVEGVDKVINLITIN